MIPVADLIAALRRIRDTCVEAGHEEPPAKDPVIRQLHGERLVRWHQAAPIRRPDGQMPPDRWVLTDAGRVWLAEHDKENRSA